VPRQVFKSSHNKYIFDCDVCGHEFAITLTDVTNSGNWCSKCNYKTELKLFNFLNEHFEGVIREFKKEWCKHETFLPFDFCIDNMKIIIELDGPQHFVQISNWTAPEITQGFDILKMKAANLNGYSVIRILQVDVFGDKYDWQSELLAAIQQSQSHPSPSNTFLCKNDEYSVFQHVPNILTST